MHITTVRAHNGDWTCIIRVREQHRILATYEEDYLVPIYKSEATFVFVLLGKEYPNRIWTRFESDQFKERFGEDATIPSWFSAVPPGTFDSSAKVGGFTIDHTKEVRDQVEQIGSLLCKRIIDYKEQMQSKAEPEPQQSFEL